MASDNPAPLNNAQRSDHLSRMARETVDVLVIGGGVVGAGVALDAASRGLSVALVEAGDYGCGASSNSTKLIHGGIRYLEMLDFALVRESLAERTILETSIAPHLVSELPFMIPQRGSAASRLYLHAGVWLYEALAKPARRSTDRSRRRLSSNEAQERFPSLTDRVRGAVQYVDAQVDDARFVLELVRTAVSRGALAASRARVESLAFDRSTVRGARIVDVVNATRFEVSARCVVNATGSSTDEIESMTSSPVRRVRASKGVHVTVAGERIAGECALISKTDKSVLMVIPWQGVWLIGTTDSEHDTSLPVSVDKAEVEYLLEQANEVLDVRLSHDDVLSVFAGLRPLVSTGEADTTKLSRRHVIRNDGRGFISASGGKYTTYRKTAADAVDAVCGHLGIRLRCSTDEIPLVGAMGHKPESTFERRYGAFGAEVAKVRDKDRGLDRSVAGIPDLSAAEVVYLARNEAAMSLEDVLERRTHLAHTRADNGLDAAADVASLLAGELGWSEARRVSEIEAYEQRWRTIRELAGLSGPAGNVATMAEDEKRKESIEAVETDSGEKQPASRRDAEKSKIEAESIEDPDGDQKRS